MLQVVRNIANECLYIEVPCPYEQMGCKHKVSPALYLEISILGIPEKHLSYHTILFSFLFFLIENV